MLKYFDVSVAGKNIRIECHDRTVFRQCRSYLSHFDESDLIIAPTMEEIEAESTELPPINEYYEGVVTTRFYGESENRVICRKIANAMLSFDTFLMHGSVVALDNQAYMFTASSGVGKTTRTRIFRDIYPSSIVINGDKPLIKITPREAIACGTPWCGKEGWNTNIMVPLRAIFLLERAREGEESSIEEISLGKAFPFLLQQTHRPEDPDLIRKSLILLKALEGRVKIYKFRSTPTEESVRLAYETARQM